jgi:hypothetical protein
MISSILVFLLISVSIAYMWSNAEIFLPLRNRISRIPYIRKPFICPECFSFWAGIIASLVYNPFIGVIPIVINNITCGLITHLVTCILYKKEIL